MLDLRQILAEFAVVANNIAMSDHRVSMKYGGIDTSSCISSKNPIRPKQDLLFRGGKPSKPVDGMQPYNY